MPRDLRHSINEYPDRVYYYPSTAVKGNTLVKDAKPLGRFYCNDIVAFAWKPVTTNGNLNSNYEYIGTIQTVDEISDIRPQMYVQYANGGGLFIIDEIIESEITDKRYSSRPAIQRTLVLRGIKK